MRWLPADAAVWAGEPVSWTVPLELAATQVELTHSVCRLLAQLGGAKGGRVPKQLHVPRPTDAKQPATAGFDAARFESYLARMGV